MLHLSSRSLFRRRTHANVSAMQFHLEFMRLLLAKNYSGGSGKPRLARCNDIFIDVSTLYPVWAQRNDGVRQFTNRYCRPRGRHCHVVPARLFISIWPRLRLYLLDRPCCEVPYRVPTIRNKLNDTCPHPESRSCISIDQRLLEHAVGQLILYGSRAAMPASKFP
jgi:hypothetical protein